MNFFQKASVVHTTLALAALFASAASAAADYAVDKAEMRAQLSPVRYAMLAAEVGAKVRRIAVREGESFAAGQVLVEFDCTLQNAQLARAEAQLVAAQNTYTGNVRLAELQAIGKVELNNSQAELDKARADVTLLKATVERCVVTAPFAGRSGEQKAREQQFVQIGQPLLEIVDDSVLELEFIVPSAWLAWLKPGHKFNVRIDDLNKSVPFKLVRTAARVDPVSQSVKAVAVVDGRQAGLLPGMSGKVLLAPPAAKQ